MHDIRLIRDDPDGFDAAMRRRGLPPQAAEILRIDSERRRCITEAEAALAERNTVSRQVGQAKASGDAAAFARLRALVAAKKDEIATLEHKAAEWDESLKALLTGLPNMPSADTPDGADEADNVEIRRWGEPRQFAFAPKHHFEIAEAMMARPGGVGLMDFGLSAKLSGSRFMILAGAIARLHRALASFMLEKHTTENGLTEVWTPVLVRENALFGTGQLPKFADDLFQTTGDHWLVPTAEVTLTNLVSDQIVDETTLPRRYTAWTQCFRAEAGAAGRDVAGILRQHQFEKVEMVSITSPEKSDDELKRMTRCAEGILETLALPYRTMALCTGDMGFSARRTHDLEVWLPGQNTYREISSCSTCGDFQARRMNARCRAHETERPRFVHTLNGSGLAVGRTLIAVLENYQQADGSVLMPAALRPYLGGVGALSAEGEFV
jgi:seryl-tRNA synthetase